MILTHAGQVTEPGTIDLEGPRQTPFAPILYAGGNKSHKRYTYSIEFVVAHLVDWAEAESPQQLGLFPFASNTGSGYFCLDYRSNRNRPSVVFVDLDFDFSEKGRSGLPRLICQVCWPD
ncbi:MAG: SMI1/KNR4 family protein [Rhodospirillales bacterium]|nr:SMI1/KNR4 family protein [Rhodospirillales bacterium]